MDGCLYKDNSGDIHYIRLSSCLEYFLDPATGKEIKKLDLETYKIISKDCSCGKIHNNSAITKDRPAPKNKPSDLPGMFGSKIKKTSSRLNNLFIMGCYRISWTQKMT